MKKVLLYDSKSYDKEFFLSANREHSFELQFFEGKLDKHTVKFAKGFDVISPFVNDRLNLEVINKLHSYNVPLIAMRCAGYNNVDLDAAYKKIHIARVPAYSPFAVAEHALALLLTLNRKIHRAYNRTRDNNFSLQGLVGFDLYKKKVGVIGTGKIGRVFINILKGLGVEILAYDLYPDLEYANQAGIRYTTLNEIYENADIISLHCPLNPSTLHLINSESISLMKQGVVIINTSRGALIETSALIEGLKSGKCGGAGLDVYEEESDYFFEDHSQNILSDDLLARLLSFNNVILTSHQAFLTKEALTNIAETTLANISEFFTKGTLSNEICYRCNNECVKEKLGRCF